MAFPGTYNFNYYRGDTSQIVVRPKNANGSTFDLTGYNAAYTIATARGTGQTQYDAEALISVVNGTVTCTIYPGTGRSLTPGTYVYDIQINNGTTIVYTILTGTISVTDDITGAV